jgi:hypothetical protein
MANKKRNRSTTPASRALTDQLNVRITTELLRRVSAVAGATGKTLAKFVSETLDERTAEHIADVGKIIDREKLQKKWHQETVVSGRAAVEENYVQRKESGARKASNKS